MYLSSFAGSLFFFSLSRGPLFSGNLGEALVFVVHHGSIAAMISAILTPIAYREGARLRTMLEHFFPRRARIYYLSVSALLAACFAVIFIHPLA